MPDLAELLRQALMGQSAGGVVPQLAGADVPYAQQPRIQITPRAPDGPEPYGIPPSQLADLLRSALMGPSAGGVAPQIAGGTMPAAQPTPLGIPPMPPRSALDTSGMGALTPPDTFTGRAAEAAMGDIRDPAQRQAAIDFAMGMVGPGAIKGVRGFGGGTKVNQPLTPQAQISPSRLPEGFSVAQEGNMFSVKNSSEPPNVHYAVADSAEAAIRQFYSSHPKFSPNAPRTAAEALAQFDRESGFPANDNPLTATPPTLDFKSAGAVRGEGAPTEIPSNRIDRPPTAKELREAAAYDKILAEGRARAEARKAAAAAAQPAPPGETLNYQSAGAVRGGAIPAAEEAAPAAAPKPPLAIKNAIEAPSPPDDMVRLYRGGGNNAGGPKWVTTDRRYAERYTTPGLAHSEGAGNYLQYVDVPKSDPRVQIPAGQSTHSFEASPDIADRLKPLYSDPRNVTAPQAEPRPMSPWEPRDPKYLKAETAALPAAADISGKVSAAYEAAQRAQGGGSVWISDVAQRAGVPIADLHAYLLRQARAGDVTLHPSTIIPDKYPPGAADAAVKLPGHEPLVMMRLK